MPNYAGGVELLLNSVNANYDRRIQQQQIAMDHERAMFALKANSAERRMQYANQAMQYATMQQDLLGRRDEHEKQMKVLGLEAQNQAIILADRTMDHAVKTGEMMAVSSKELAASGLALGQMNGMRDEDTGQWVWRNPFIAGVTSDLDKSVPPENISDAYNTRVLSVYKKLRDKNVDPMEATRDAKAYGDMTLVLRVLSDSTKSDRLSRRLRGLIDGGVDMSPEQYKKSMLGFLGSLHYDKHGRPKLGKDAESYIMGEKSLPPEVFERAMTLYGPDDTDYHGLAMFRAGKGREFEISGMAGVLEGSYLAQRSYDLAEEHYTVSMDMMQKAYAALSGDKSVDLNFSTKKRGGSVASTGEDWFSSFDRGDEPVDDGDSPFDDGDSPPPPASPSSAGVTAPADTSASAPGDTSSVGVDQTEQALRNFNDALERINARKVETEKDVDFSFENQSLHGIDIERTTKDIGVDEVKSRPRRGLTLGAINKYEPSGVDELGLPKGGEYVGSIRAATVAEYRNGTLTEGSKQIAEKEIQRAYDYYRESLGRYGKRAGVTAPVLPYKEFKADILGNWDSSPGGKLHPMQPFSNSAMDAMVRRVLSGGPLAPEEDAIYGSGYTPKNYSRLLALGHFMARSGMAGATLKDRNKTDPSGPKNRDEGFTKSFNIVRDLGIPSDTGKYILAILQQESGMMNEGFGHEAGRENVNVYGPGQTGFAAMRDAGIPFNDAIRVAVGSNGSYAIGVKASALYFMHLLKTYGSFEKAVKAYKVGPNEELFDSEDAVRYYRGVVSKLRNVGEVMLSREEERLKESLG